MILCTLSSIYDKIKVVIMLFESLNEQATHALGEQIGKTAKPGEVYALLGELGVGKTVFTQGFAKGIGITDSVSSPTFTILQEYDEGRVPLYHFDVYRIGDPEEMDEVGYEDYFYGQGVCLVEWASLIEELMPPETRWITIEKDLSKGFDYRKITIKEGR